MSLRLFATFSLSAILLNGVSVESVKAEEEYERAPLPKFTLSSEDFKNKKELPLSAVCEEYGGESTLPQLSWTKPPLGTKSLLLVMKDLDAETHDEISEPSILFGLMTSPPVRSISDDSIRGTVLLNDGDEEEGEEDTYLSPCPPPGEKRRYQFTLYALNKKLVVDSTSEASEVLRRLRARAKRRGLASPILAKSTLKSYFTAPEGVIDEDNDDSDNDSSINDGNSGEKS